MKVFNALLLVFLISRTMLLSAQQLCDNKACCIRCCGGADEFYINFREQSCLDACAGNTTDCSSAFVENRNGCKGGRSFGSTAEAVILLPTFFGGNQNSCCVINADDFLEFLVGPNAFPFCSPLVIPTEEPTEAPTDSPSPDPTNIPTREPTISPSRNPTLSPIKSPTTSPTETPTQSPTRFSSSAPTTFGDSLRENLYFQPKVFLVIFSVLLFLIVLLAIIHKRLMKKHAMEAEIY